MLADVGLPEQDAALRVQPRCDQHRRGVERIARQRLRVVRDAGRMEIHDAVDRRIAAILALHPAADGPDVVADVLAPGRLDAGEDAHGARQSMQAPTVTRDALHRVVHVALQVPDRLERLAVPGRVGRSGAEHVLAGRGVPFEAPAAPCGVAQRLVEEGRREGRAAVGRDHHALDRAVAGPGAAREGHQAGLEHAPAGKEVGHARRDHQRARQHAGDLLAGHARGVVEPVAHRLLVALEGLLEQGDAGEPLHVRHAVPARHHEPQRVPVLRRQRRSVHLVGEEGVLRVRQAQRALIGLRDAALDPLVEPGEQRFDGGFADRPPRRGADAAACRPIRRCRPPRSARAG